MYTSVKATYYRRYPARPYVSLAFTKHVWHARDWSHITIFFKQRFSELTEQQKSENVKYYGTPHEILYFVNVSSLFWFPFSYPFGELGIVLRITEVHQNWYKVDSVVAVLHCVSKKFPPSNSL